jgi:TrmH family RNA methyltransferase
MAAAEAGVPLVDVFVSDPADPVARELGQASVVTPELLESVASTAHPQGVVAVAAWRPRAELDSSYDHVVVLDGVRDPGNVGTLIRTAAGLGVDAVILTKGSCDPTNPKALRATAGGIFYVDVVSGADAVALLDVFTAWQVDVVIADSRGGVPPAEVDVGDRWALWIGAEAHGVHPTARARAAVTVTLALRPGVDSLNAAAAGAILLDRMLNPMAVDKASSHRR